MPDPMQGVRVVDIESPSGCPIRVIQDVLGMPVNPFFESGTEPSPAPRLIRSDFNAQLMLPAPGPESTTTERTFI
jgi:hypothetical protein